MRARQRLFRFSKRSRQSAILLNDFASYGLHIARYVGDRGGYTMGHRDNVSAATGYRRFALSMSLNEDFEGGEIVFKEFSPRGYRPPAGTAMVFSSSLLHEVQETTKGTRYNLISHLFNEDSINK